MRAFPAKSIFAFSIISLLYFVIAGLFAATLLPNCDEAWFLLPGYNLIENGFFGTTVLEETATFRQVRLDGINHSTYWVMPLYSLVQAVWGKLNDFQLINQRFLSIIFGFVTLSAWASLIKKLTGDSSLTVLAVTLTAIDYHFIYSSGLGRMDMMAVAFGTTGLAVFVDRREKNLNCAVLASFTATALSFFTHPLGLIWFVSLTIFIVLLDFKNLKPRHFLLAAVPYLFLGLLWLIYILQSPDLFLLQFGGNASDRWSFFRAPFNGLWLEIKDRYFYNFGIGEGLSRNGQIRILILAVYLSAMTAVSAIKSLRNTLLVRLLLLLAIQEFVMLLLLDSMRQHLYMIYITPTFSIILAVWINWLRQRGNVFRLTAVALASIVILINLSVISIRVKENAYHIYYLEAANFLNLNVQPNENVTASAEIWFALKNRANLTDDFRLGFRSGKKADYIVMDTVRYRDWTNQLFHTDIANHQYVADILSNEYKVVFENKNYQIYQRK